MNRVPAFPMSDSASIPDIEAGYKAGSTVARQEDFRPMVRALSRAQGFALYFVECNVPVYRREVAEAVRDSLDRPVVEVDLSDVDRAPERPSIDYFIEERLGDVPDNAVVYVWGLEHLLPSAPYDQDITRQTLIELNWRRGVYARTERPFVFWLPEYTIRYLAQNAPDFFDWNSGLFQFETPAERRGELITENLALINELPDFSSLSVHEKRAVERDLRALKQEAAMSGDTEQLIDLDRRIGLLLYYRGDLVEARKIFEEAKGFAAPGSETLLSIKHNLAALSMKEGNYASARSQYEDLLPYYESSEDWANFASALHQLATISMHQGDYDEAKTLLEESMAFQKNNGQSTDVLATRHNMAFIALKDGKYEEAKERFEDVLVELSKDSSDRWRYAATRQSLGLIAMQKGHFQEAKRQFEEVHVLRKEMGDRAGLAVTLHNLATIAVKENRYQDARRQFQQALSLADTVGNRASWAMTLGQLGVLAGNYLGRKKSGLQLAFLSYSLLADAGKTEAQLFQQHFLRFADELNLSEDALQSLVESTATTLMEEGIEPLIREAFPESAPDSSPEGEPNREGAV